MSNPEALERVRQRFALRLGRALDCGGYPSQRFERAKAFGAALQMELTSAEHLLSGQVLPELKQLLTLCEILDRSPGYFLDAQVAELPAGTRLVRPLLAGEDLVLRLPADAASADELHGGLIYHRAREAMGFGIEAGDYLIALQPSARVDAQLRQLYLFQDESGLCVCRCTELRSGRAVFLGAGEPGVARIVATAASGPTRHFSAVVGLLRCGASLHLRP